MIDIKKILITLFLFSIILILIFVCFWKPTKRTYNVNIFEEVKLGSLAQDFNNNLDNNYWTIIDGGEVYNSGLQYYTPKNVNNKNGFLEIEAKKESFKGSEYTSGLINTKDKFEFQYGKIIFRAKPAYGQGLISAICLLPADDSLYPKIDVFEALGNYDKTWVGVHYSDSNYQGDYINSSSNNNFSIYEFNWDENQISVFVDNKLLYKLDVDVPDKKMYLAVNLSVVGAWAGEPNDSILSSKFLLDYIIVIPKGVDEK